MTNQLRAWRAHAALNLGSAIRNLIAVAVPPHVDHDAETVAYFATASPWEEFLRGLGVLS